MDIEQNTINGIAIATIQSDEILIADAQSALDLIATVVYQTPCRHIILAKHTVTESLFDLRTGLAGEVLQKFVNFRVRVAIVGDYSGYTSKALQDFIRESNRGAHIFFVGTQSEALKKFGGV
jgi:hypothetical protein